MALGDFLRQEDRLDEAEATLQPFATCSLPRPCLRACVCSEAACVLNGNLDLTLDHLLEQSMTSEEAKQHLLDMLDALGPEDARYVSYRRRLASRSTSAGISYGVDTDCRAR